MRAHRADQAARAGHQPHPLLAAAIDHARVEPLEQRNPRIQRRLEIEFAAHRPLGDLGDVRLDPGIVRQLVDAFDGDHGRIHVGHQQPLGAMLGRLDDHVDARDQPLERRARTRLVEPGERQVGGDPLVDPLGGVRLAPGLGDRVARLRDVARG